MCFEYKQLSIYRLLSLPKNKNMFVKNLLLDNSLPELGLGRIRTGYPDIFLGSGANLDLKFLLKTGSGTEPDMKIFRKKSFG